MYKLGHLENNGQNQDVSQCNNRDVFTGHNMNNTSCSLSSPPSDNTTKSTTTSVLRRWRRPDTHETKHVQAKEAPAPQPSKYVSAEPDKQMNQVGNYVGSAETSSTNPGADYSMFVPQLSPVVPQSTARPYDSTKYLPHVQYSENGGYARTSPVVPPPSKVPDKTSSAAGQSSYYHQDSTNQEVHFRSPSYPIQNTPPLAHSASQKCILPIENNTYPVSNQKVSRDYPYLQRDYSVVAHNYSPQKINPAEAKISPQGVTEDPNYCLSKAGGYVQDSRISPQNMTHNYPLQNAMDRRVSPHNPKSPIYRNYPQSNINIPVQNYVPSSKSSGEYVAQNNSYYMDKLPCVSQKQGYPSEKQVLDARYVQNYGQNYVVSKTQDSKHPRDYRNVISNSKKASPPFPILEQRLNQQETNYCADYSAQGYYPSKYGPVMFSRTSPTPKIVRDSSVAGHNYIHSNVHHNPKIQPQDMMIPPNYSFPNKYYQQNQGQEWKIPKDYEQNMYLSQMNQMHARLPHNTINKNTDLPRDLSYVDQNQRLAQKGRMYCPENSPVEHLQYTGKSVVPVTQKSPKVVGYNMTEQRTPENLANEYLNLVRPCGTVMKPTEYQRNTKLTEYGPVIQSVKSAELSYDQKMSRDYLIHQQACRNEISSDQQSYVCSPPLIGQNSRNPPPYPIGYPRQSNIKLNEMPARNISPRRTFQENMPVVVFSPQHIGLPKSSPTQMYSSEYPNPQHYPGYYSRDSVYPGPGVKPGMSQYPIDQSGKYSNVHVNRNIPQQRFPFGYPEHQYYQHKHLESPEKLNYYQSNMYRPHYNLPEHLQQNVARAFEGDYRTAGAPSFDFEASRVDDRTGYDKKESDIGKSLKEFLESWEDDEEIVANLPDLVLCNNIPPEKQKLPFAGLSEEASETSKSSSEENSPKGDEADQPLYILGSTNISSEALPQYLAVYEQVDRLPDNIKGFYKGPPTNANEETPSTAIEHSEKPTEVSPDPKSVIREPLSPHDLSVNKLKDEKKIDTVAVEEIEQVLNLSTNRNKENNEFLVEEYSNASDDNNSVQETQETEKKASPSTPDTSFLETEKSVEDVTKNVEPPEDKQEETVKDFEMSVDTLQNIPEEEKKVDEERLSFSESSPIPTDADCSIMDTLEERKRENSMTEDEDKDNSIENNENPDEKDKREISSTPSVIVPNKFFDSTSLINKNDFSDKLPILINDDPIEIKDNEDEINITSTEICPEILVEEIKEPDAEPSEELAIENSTEIVDHDSQNIIFLEEIEDNKISTELSLNEATEKNSDTNLDIDVLDFETEELLPLNEDISKDIEIEKTIENVIKDQQEDLEPISFDNLINSPENIEMKDDEENIDLENNKSVEHSKEIINSPSTPNCIDLSLPDNSSSETETESSLFENVAENTEEVDFEVQHLIETDKSENNQLSSIQTDSETNIILENNSEKEEIEEDPLRIIPEQFETQLISDATSEDNKVLDNLTEEFIEDNSKCTSLLSLSPIPDCDIKVESEYFELKTTEDILEDIEIPTTVCKEISEDIKEPEAEYADKEVINDIVESDNLFESTVDKLIITNVETIQEDSSDSISQEETANKLILEEDTNDDPELDETTEIENPEKDEDTFDEYAHLVDIVKSEDVIIKEEDDLSTSNTEDLKEPSVDVKDINNFDFSYLESCTDNICEKQEAETEKLSENNSDETTKNEDLCYNENLKSLLDSSESDSEFPKVTLANSKEISNEISSNELQNESEVISDNTADKKEDSSSEITDKSEEKIDSLPEIVKPEDSEILNEPEKESEPVFNVPETEVPTEILGENEENLVEEENEVPLIDIPISEVDVSLTETEIIEPPETSEILSEVPVNDIELPENTTEIVPIETVEENVELNLNNSVLVTANVSSEENIILPENSECVVIYSEDEQYLIIQPDTDTAEIIPSEEVVVQETEIMIPEIPSEIDSHKEEEIIVEQVATEPVGDEIIICEEGIEDWVQNEEIIESNEEDSEKKNTETEDKIEVIEREPINPENEQLLQQEKMENMKQKDIRLENRDKLKKKLSFQRKKLLLARQKKKKEKLEKLTRLKLKKITETFINEEKIFSYPDSELTSIVEDKEMFMNPENPDTREYNNNSSNYPFADSSSVIKRRVSYGDFSSPKIDFKAPKRRYSSMESGRSVKKPIINLDEISKNITEVLENLTKQEIIQYQNSEKIKNEPKLEDKEEVESKIELQETEKEEFIADMSDKKEEIKLELKIEQLEKDVPNKSEHNIDVKDIKQKFEENNAKVTDNIVSRDNVTKLVEQLIKPKLIIPKTHFNLVTNIQETKPSPEQFSPLPNRKPALLKTPEIKEDNSSPVLNTARLTEPIFPKSVVPEKTTKRQNSDPRIDRPKELPLPEKEEKSSFIENKLSNSFGLTEYTKNYIKMKTGQIIDPKNLCGMNGTKRIIDPRQTKTVDQRTVEVKINNAKKKHQTVVNTISIEDSKSNEKKVKINLQDYRNRKSQSSSDSNVSSSENSMSSPQIEDVTKKDSEEMKPEESEKTLNEISDNKIEEVIIKPKTSSDPLLTQEVTEVTTNPKEPKETNSTNNHQEDSNNLETDSNVNSKSMIDLKQNKPKKRKRRFRNLYTVDEEDEVPTKQNKNSLDNLETKLNGILTTNEDSTSSSKISEDSQQSTANSSSGSKMNEDSQSSEMSSGTNGEFLCCLDLNSNGTSDNNCGFKCHIKLNAIGEKIRDYEINKNSCNNPNRLKLTLKPVKKKKPAFSEVLSNLDSLVETELHTKRKKKLNGTKNSVSENNGDGTLWTIKNKVPKVIIKRNGSGYCAVFRDVSSNPIWQPKIRLKRQKYIESLVLSNVKV